MIYYLFQTLWMIIYVPWLGLTTAMVELASHSLAIFIVGLYILCSLPSGKKLIVTLAQKLCAVALFPINWTLWQIWYILTAQASYLLCTLTHLIRNRTQRLTTQMKDEPSTALFNCTLWTYYGFVIFYFDNTSAAETILDALLQQLFFVLLLRCLDGFWLMIFQGSHASTFFQLTKHAKEWWCPVPAVGQSEICTLGLPSRKICTNEPSLEPIPSTLRELPPDSINFHLLTVCDEKDDDDYHFGNIQIPLNTRTRCDRVARRLILPPSGSNN